MAADFETARQLFADGLAHVAGGRWAEAEAAFRGSLAIVPGRPSTLTNLGATLLQLQRPAEALAALDEAIAGSPDDAEALGHRGHALNLLGRHAEALPDLERFVALQPQRPEGWFHHARTLLLLGRPAAALASFERTLALVPGHAQAWSGRGGALRELGRDEEAAAAFERAIALGADAALHRWYLAAIRGGEVPAMAPRAFVEDLFGSYADGFDDHLVRTLRYRGPEAVAELLAVLGRPRWRSALDLGCGTGLCGVLLRPLADRLAGVDLAAPMLTAAAARGIYDTLVRADVAEHLQSTPERHDLVVAADVLVYVGDLQPVFEGVRRVLDDDGAFVFTVEAAADGSDVVLQPTMRYAHGERSLRRLAAAAGFVVERCDRRAVRQDQGRDVPGFCLLLVRG